MFQAELQCVSVSMSVFECQFKVVYTECRSTHNLRIFSYTDHHPRYPASILQDIDLYKVTFKILWCGGGMEGVIKSGENVYSAPPPTIAKCSKNKRKS